MRFMKWAMILLLAILAGCTQGRDTAQPQDSQDQTNQQQQPQTPPTPVKLTFFNLYGVWPEDQFKQYIEESTRAKYPHISLEIINGVPKDLEELIVSNEIPDIVASGPSSLAVLMDLGLTADMTPLVKESGFDLGRVEETAVQFIRNHSVNRELLSIPMARDVNALYYNQDLFDKFAVSFPTDGMTWNDAIDLARLLIRSDDEVQYRGLDFQTNIFMAYSQKGVSYVDPATDKAILNQDAWRNLIQPLIQTYALPGNEFKHGANQDDFLKNRNLAMYATFNIMNLLTQMDGEAFNWDVVTLPTFPDEPNTGSGPFPQHMLVTSTSKHKADAFKIIEIALSDEIQSARGADYGVITVLNNVSVQEQFMKNSDAVKGKNIAALFKLSPASPREITPYDGLINPKMNAAVFEVLKNNKDLNTALRDVEEEANKIIEEQKAKAN